MSSRNEAGTALTAGKVATNKSNIKQWADAPTHTSIECASMKLLSNHLTSGIGIRLWQLALTWQRLYFKCMVSTKQAGSSPSRAKSKYDNGPNMKFAITFVTTENA
jgi:hypothetical protein